MGNTSPTAFCRSRISLSDSSSLEVHASADVVWETLTDAKNIPNFITNVHELEIVGDATEQGAGVNAGRVIREVRSLPPRGQLEEVYMTITEITSSPKDSQDGFPVRTLRVRSGRGRKLPGKSRKQDCTQERDEESACNDTPLRDVSRHQNPVVDDDAERVGTWMIVPLTDTSCQFLWSYGAVPFGFCETIWTFCCRRYVIKVATAYMLEDIHEYAAEAERRQREQTVGHSSNNNSIGSAIPMGQQEVTSSDKGGN